jgi:hypothetical protein
VDHYYFPPFVVADGVVSCVLRSTLGGWRTSRTSLTHERIRDPRGILMSTKTPFHSSHLRTTLNPTRTH